MINAPKKIVIWERWEEEDGKIFQLLSYDKGYTWKREYIPYLKTLPYIVLGGDREKA